MDKKIMEVGDRLYDMAEHNRITNYEEWSKQLYTLLDEAFPDRERVGDLVADVETYLHNKHSFGFCDLCGEYINYENDRYFDTGLAEGEEQDWIYKSEYLWSLHYGDTANENITDVCPMCYHALATEVGFRSLLLTDDNSITIGGGKNHAHESMGDFLDEVGLSAETDAFEISYALLSNGLVPLRREHYPFLNDWEKMRDFVKLSKEDFLASYSYLTETEYDMTKKFWDNYHA